MDFIVMGIGVIVFLQPFLRVDSKGFLLKNVIGFILVLIGAFMPPVVQSLFGI
jgi:hypothetical protein